MNTHNLKTNHSVGKNQNSLMKLISHSPNIRYQQRVFCPQRLSDNARRKRNPSSCKVAELQQKAGGFLDSRQCYDLIITWVHPSDKESPEALTGGNITLQCYCILINYLAIKFLKTMHVDVSSRFCERQLNLILIIIYWIQSYNCHLKSVKSMWINKNKRFYLYNGGI